MTLPFERSNAVKNARKFLLRLLDSKKTPRVPKIIRREAYWVLRHFPSDFDMEQAAKNFSKVFKAEK